MNEELTSLLASITTAENVDTIEQIITNIQTTATAEPEPADTETETEPADTENWQEKYNALQQKYVARFMSNEEPETETETETEQDETESDDSTIAELFK